MVHAVTAYDRRESTKASYNRYALGIYLGRVDDVQRDIDAGASVRAAIVAGFTGILRDAVLRGVGEPKFSESEAESSSWAYQPVKAAS